MKRLVIFTVIFACIITLSGCGSVESKPDTELQMSAAAEDYPVNYADNVTKKLSETEIRQLIARALKITACIQENDESAALNEMRFDEVNKEFNIETSRSEDWEMIRSEDWVTNCKVSTETSDIIKASQSDPVESAEYPDKIYDIGFDVKCDKGTAFVVFHAFKLNDGGYAIEIDKVYVL